ncbi:hypothetical protein JCM10213_003392 [Rhodosporidiobolus nylandii]
MYGWKRQANGRSRDVLPIFEPPGADSASDPEQQHSTTSASSSSSSSDEGDSVADEGDSVADTATSVAPPDLDPKEEKLPAIFMAELRRVEKRMAEKNMVDLRRVEKRMAEKNEKIARRSKEVARRNKEVARRVQSLEDEKEVETLVREKERNLFAQSITDQGGYSGAIVTLTRHALHILQKERPHLLPKLAHQWLLAHPEYLDQRCNVLLLSTSASPSNPHPLVSFAQQTESPTFSVAQAQAAVEELASSSLFRSHRRAVNDAITRFYELGPTRNEHAHAAFPLSLTTALSEVCKGAGWTRNEVEELLKGAHPSDPAKFPDDVHRQALEDAKAELESRRDAAVRLRNALGPEELQHPDGRMVRLNARSLQRLRKEAGRQLRAHDASLRKQVENLLSTFPSRDPAHSPSAARHRPPSTSRSPTSPAPVSSTAQRRSPLLPPDTSTPSPSPPPAASTSATLPPAPAVLSSPSTGAAPASAVSAPPLSPSASAHPSPPYIGAARVSIPSARPSSPTFSSHPAQLNQVPPTVPPGAKATDSSATPSDIPSAEAQQPSKARRKKQRQADNKKAAAKAAEAAAKATEAARAQEESVRPLSVAEMLAKATVSRWRDTPLTAEELAEMEELAKQKELAKLT